MIKWFFVFLLVGFFGCGPVHYLKKADRAIAKAQQLGAKVTQDTVFINSNILIPEYRTDTLIKINSFTDTIRLENEKIKWKVKVNTIEKTVYVEAKCKADTVIIRVPVEVTRKIKAGYSLWDIIILCIVVAIVAAILSKIFWKKQ